VTETEGESGSRKDRIILKGITLYGYDGVIPRDQARGVSHKLVVDLQLVADLKVAGETDQLSRTINYVQVFDAIGGALQKSNSLLETMANNIAKTLLHNFTHIHQVTVCIKKPADAINGINGINGILDYVAFQIVRSRTNWVIQDVGQKNVRIGRNNSKLATNKEIIK